MGQRQFDDQMEPDITFLAVSAQCGDQEQQRKHDKYDADDEGGPRAQMVAG